MKSGSLTLAAISIPPLLFPLICSHWNNSILFLTNDTVQVASYFPYCPVTLLVAKQCWWAAQAICIAGASPFPSLHKLLPFLLTHLRDLFQDHLVPQKCDELEEAGGLLSDSHSHLFTGGLQWFHDLELPPPLRDLPLVNNGVQRGYWFIWHSGDMGKLICFQNKCCVGWRVWGNLEKVRKKVAMYVRYLLPCNKSPQNFVAQINNDLLFLIILQVG